MATVKAALREYDLAQLRALGREALAQPDAAGVRALAEELLSRTKEMNA